MRGDPKQTFVHVHQGNFKSTTQLAHRAVESIREKRGLMLHAMVERRCSQYDILGVPLNLRNHSGRVHDPLGLTELKIILHNPGHIPRVGC